MTPRRRTLLVRAAIVAVLLGLFLALPAALALRPQFMQRYPGLDTAYLGWERSEHAKVACRSCHVAPGLASQAAYGVRMLGEFYLGAVTSREMPHEFRAPTTAACSQCHDDLRTVSPAGDLAIPHRAHVSVLGIDCVECHDVRMVHEPGPDGVNTPPMSGCLTCHNGEIAKADCSACHTDKDRPATHEAASWLVEHPAKAGEECNSCHDWTEGWCADCHDRRPKSHAADWRAVHGSVVKERRNCEACHEGPFCERCHGEVPAVNLDPSLKRVVR